MTKPTDWKGPFARAAACWLLLSLVFSAALGLRIVRMNTLDLLSRDALTLVFWTVATYGLLTWVPGLVWGLALALIVGQIGIRRLAAPGVVAFVSCGAFGFLGTLVVSRHVLRGEIRSEGLAAALVVAALTGAVGGTVARLPRQWGLTLGSTALLGLVALGAVEFRSFDDLGLAADVQPRHARRSAAARSSSASVPARPLLLVAFDGLSPDRLDRLMEDGQLSSFARVTRNGAYGRLRTLKPTYSPILWTTVATGKMPGKHGVFNAWTMPGVDATVQTYPVNIGLTRVYESLGSIGLFEKHLLTNSLRRTKAIWNIVSDTGGRVGIVQWWPSWPVEPLHGVVVSDRFWPALKSSRSTSVGTQDVVHPSPLMSELTPLFVDPESLEAPQLAPFLPTAARSVDPTSPLAEREANIRALVRESYARDLTIGRVARHLLGQSEYDFFAVYLKGVDSVSHAAGNNLYNPGTREIPEELQVYEGVTDEYYRFTDEALRMLLDTVGDSTNVVICSDHGFTWLANDTFTHTDAAPPGVLVLHGPDVRPGVHIEDAHLVDVAPTILHLIGRPVGLDMDGRVLEEALSSTLPAPRFIASHDTEARQGQASQSPLDEKVRDELRALGYIE